MPPGLGAAEALPAAAPVSGEARRLFAALWRAALLGPEGSSPGTVNPLMAVAGPRDHSPEPKGFDATPVPLIGVAGAPPPAPFPEAGRKEDRAGEAVAPAAGAPALAPAGGAAGGISDAALREPRPALSGAAAPPPRLGGGLLGRLVAAGAARSPLAPAAVPWAISVLRASAADPAEAPPGRSSDTNLDPGVPIRTVLGHPEKAAVAGRLSGARGTPPLSFAARLQATPAVAGPHVRLPRASPPPEGAPTAGADGGARDLRREAAVSVSAPGRGLGSDPRHGERLVQIQAQAGGAAAVGRLDTSAPSTHPAVSPPGVRPSLPEKHPDGAGRPAEPPSPEPAGGKPWLAAPVRRIHLQIGETGAVRLDVVERAGGIHVAVRSRRSRLSSALRDELGVLVHKVQVEGFRIETWTPPHTPRRDSSYPDGSGGGRQGGDGSPGNPSHGSGRQDGSESDQSAPPAWLEELGAGAPGFGNQSEEVWRWLQHRVR